MAISSQIPDITGVQDPQAARILTAVKQALDNLMGKTPNRPKVAALGATANLGGVINKINEMLGRTQDSSTSNPPTPAAASSSGTLGTTTNDNATAGYIGEYIESVVSAVSFPATGTFGDFTSISLTPGDWDISANIEIDVSNGAITFSQAVIGISTTTGNSATGLVPGSNRVQAGQPGANAGSGASIASFRMALASTTTVFFKFLATFSGTAPLGNGRISARRVR